MQAASEDALVSLISKEDLMQLARKWRLQLSESEPAAFWAKYSTRGSLARILAFHVGEWEAIRQQWLSQRSIDIGPVGPRAKGGIQIALGGDARPPAADARAAVPAGRATAPAGKVRDEADDPHAASSGSLLSPMRLGKGIALHVAQPGGHAASEQRRASTRIRDPAMQAAAGMAGGAQDS